MSDFYPRPPRGGRPASTRRTLRPLRISIHALREEGDPFRRPRGSRARNFYPRPPRGGRRFLARRCGCRQYFYPRPPRGGRLPILPRENDLAKISIHALREEGDGVARLALVCSDMISIHALREEGDLLGGKLFWMVSYFYPRPPRGGRRAARAAERSRQYFYPRPPRGGRPRRRTGGNRSDQISIHALREEGDSGS